MHTLGGIGANSKAQRSYAQGGGGGGGYGGGGGGSFGPYRALTKQTNTTLLPMKAALL